MPLKAAPNCRMTPHFFGNRANRGGISVRSAPRDGSVFTLRTAPIELFNRISYFAFSEEDLIKQLESLRISLESLEPHHKSDYPI